MFLPASRRALLGALACGLVLVACAPATVRLPADLPGDSLAYDVSGHSPRRWQQPLRFGPYRTVGMREGMDFSWTLPLFGGHLARASKPYRYTMVTLGEAPVEVECRTRATLLLGRGVSIDITETMEPRMACCVRHDADEPLVFELADKGNRYDGAIFPARGGRPLFSVRSLHRFEGSSLASMEPLGYEILRGGEVVAAIETLNAGRVFMNPDTSPRERVMLAAMSAALLMFDPGQSSVFE